MASVSSATGCAWPASWLARWRASGPPRRCEFVDFRPPPARGQGRLTFEDYPARSAKPRGNAAWLRHHVLASAKFCPFENGAARSRHPIVRLRKTGPSLHQNDQAPSGPGRDCCVKMGISDSIAPPRGNNPVLLVCPRHSAIGQCCCIFRGGGIELQCLRYSISASAG